MNRSSMLAAQVLALTTFLALAGTGEAAPPPALSLDRAALVVTAQGASFNQQTPVFLPSVGVSYSITSALSGGVLAEHDFHAGGSIVKAALRAHVADFGAGAVGLGVNYAKNLGALAGDSHWVWTASAHGDFPIARGKPNFTGQGRVLLWLVTSAERDLHNSTSILRLGLRGNLWGGQPR